MSDPSVRHDGDDEPTGVPFGGSSAADRSSSSNYVPLGDINLLSSARLSSELDPVDDTDQPGTDQPGTDQPGTDQPGTDPAIAEAIAVDSPSDSSTGAAAEVSVESLLDDLERVTKERDGYLDDTRRVAAEFANFRRQTDKRQIEVIEQAAASLAEQLLPVLDACEGALAHGTGDVEPIYNMLIATLEKSGLSVLRPLGDPFDPNRHEAVIHEEGEGDGPHVAEVLRTGYVWNGRVLRPALVKVRD